jgi:hypothetical protein
MSIAATKSVVVLLLVWQYFSIAASHEQYQNVPHISLQTDLDSEPQPDSFSNFIWDFPQDPSSDRLMTDRDPLELVDVLVHLRSARNTTAMREMDEIAGSKFIEYVSHNTFAIVAPAKVIAKCAYNLLRRFESYPSWLPLYSEFLHLIQLIRQQYLPTLPSEA